MTDLLSADVSVLFYDTTSVSFHLEEADPEGGLRRHGYSKKKRPDLPQIVVALAINRDGIPVRHWIYPGNRIDVSTVEEVTRDLLGLRPRRFLFVGDRGMVSQANLDFLESRRLGYLLGCKIRTDPALEAHLLSLRGRYRPVARPGREGNADHEEAARCVPLCRSEAGRRRRAQACRGPRTARAALRTEEGRRPATRAPAIRALQAASHATCQAADGTLRIDPPRSRPRHVTMAVRADDQRADLPRKSSCSATGTCGGRNGLPLVKACGSGAGPARTPERITPRARLRLAYLLARSPKTGTERLGTGPRTAERISLTELTTDRASFSDEGSHQRRA